MRKRARQRATATFLKAASPPVLPTVRNILNSFSGFSRNVFSIESGQDGAKAGRAAAGYAASAFLAPLERKLVAGGPLARGIFFRSPQTKQPLALGATKRDLRATRFGRKDISYMKNSPTKARYNTISVALFSWQPWRGCFYS